MSFLSRWCQVQGVVTIKSIWEELLRALPLGCELLHSLVIDDQLVIGLEVVVSYPAVLSEHHWHTIVCRVLVSQRLQHDFIQEFQVLHNL